LEYNRERKYDRPIRTPEQRKSFRLIGELTLLSALIFGAALSTGRDRTELRAPFVVGQCEESKSHLNYNDKNT
jgi:hypothetical protein